MELSILNLCDILHSSNEQIYILCGTNQMITDLWEGLAIGAHLSEVVVNSDVY